MKIVFSTLIILISLNLFSQKNDYVITINHDTIFGEKLKGKNNYSVKFRDSKKTYSPDEIIGYYVHKDNRYMERVISPFKWGSKPNNYSFLIRLIGGEIKLFVEYDRQFGNNYFISKKDSKLEKLYHGWDLKLKEPVYKTLMKYISDNEETTIKLNELKSTKPIPKTDRIIKLINDYNNTF